MLLDEADVYTNVPPQAPIDSVKRKGKGLQFSYRMPIPLRPFLAWLLVSARFANTVIKNSGFLGLENASHVLMGS